MDLRDVQFLVVHCSATKPDMDIGVDEITEWHVARGWSTIGYHFVIRRDGKIELGRDLTTMGAHVRGYNENSVGICMVGGLDENGKPANNFTPFQFSSLRVLLETLFRMCPEAKARGHRDFPGVAKDCPCFDVIKWWYKEGKDGVSSE